MMPLTDATFSEGSKIAATIGLSSMDGGEWRQHMPLIVQI
jgi:hypothetical protein